MAEKLALEQAALRISALRETKWTRCVLWGIFLAILVANFCTPDVDTFFSKTTEHLIEIIGAIIGFLFGFGIAWKWQLTARTSISKRIRKQARARQQKFGAIRTLSWDAESFVVKSPMSQTQINWRVIDKLVNGTNGIHLLSDDEAVYGIPKAAIPQSISQDELVKVWQGYFSKPPKLT